MPRGTHAKSIASNGDQKEDKTLLQHSQLPQHGEFWHASVSERQRSRACGQNLRVPFLRTVLPPEVEESARVMAATARQKRSYLHHQGEFQHNYFDFVSLHHSNHDGVVRIFVGHSEIVKRLLIIYITRGNRTPGSRVATPVATRRSEAKYCNSFQLTHRPRGNCAQSIASNGDQKDDKTLLQHSQLSQHGEFWHVSISEPQRSRPCGQNLRVPFQRTVLPPDVEESARAMAANGETKAFISSPPR